MNEFALKYGCNPNQSPARIFMTEGELETFPSWSPDGRYLYFATYEAEELPVKFSLTGSA